MNPDKKMQEAWREHELSQLRYFSALSLRAKLEAVEGMADVVRRFEQLRAEGNIRSSSAILHEPRSRYAPDKN